MEKGSNETIAVGGIMGFIYGWCRQIGAKGTSLTTLRRHSDNLPIRCWSSRRYAHPREIHDRIGLNVRVSVLLSTGQWLDLTS